ncbi:hypothetical protein GCM10008934_40790 [Virgibacillus salarius]
MFDVYWAMLRLITSLSTGAASTNFAKKNTLQSGFSARANPAGVYVISLRYEKVQQFLS